MLLIVIVMLYSLPGLCASPVDALGDLRDVDGNYLDNDELGPLLEASDQPIARAMKRTCQTGIHSHNCALMNLMNLKNAERYLASADSPGKRSSEQNKGFLRYLLTQYELSDANRKRSGWSSCNFRLGDHCMTERLDRAANQYYYLKSDRSPGRRRRDTVLFNRKLA